MSLAIYAGSFDPVTEGHLSVIRQAARLFSHLRVLVAVNPAKQGRFTPDERVEMLRGALARFAHVTCDRTDGLVVEYARAIGGSFLVRGVRGPADLAFEIELCRQNRALAPELGTIFLPALEAVADVSSSGLVARAARGEPLAGLCPPEVEARLRARFGPAASAEAPGAPGGSGAPTGAP